jgi:hypothetical protein
MQSIINKNFRKYSSFIKPFSSKSDLKNESNFKTTFKVLLWNKFFGNTLMHPNLTQLKCEFTNCILTEDRNYLNTSDALVFHLRDIKANDMLDYHLNKQKWTLYNWEPPCFSPVDSLEPLGDNINWTISYRRDSDIFNPYGEVYKCNKSSKTKYSFEGKKKSIAWFVNNCHSESKRDIYVKELQKYIDVDIYGKCGPLKCPFNNTCYEMMAQNYKFYLSFENSVSFENHFYRKFKNFIFLFVQQICKDYVTEKLFKIIGYPVIPVSIIKNFKRQNFHFKLRISFTFFYIIITLNFLWGLI